MKNVSIIFACLHFKNCKNALIFETIIGAYRTYPPAWMCLLGLKRSLAVPRGVFIFQDRKEIPWAMEMALSNVMWNTGENWQLQWNIWSCDLCEIISKTFRNPDKLHFQNFFTYHGLYLILNCTAIKLLCQVEHVLNPSQAQGAKQRHFEAFSLYLIK